MTEKRIACPDCDDASRDLSRREFLAAAGAVAATAGATPIWAQAKEAPATGAKKPPETVVKQLYEATGGE